MKETDFIIVGQGLAGTLMAHFLQKNNKSVLVIDPGEGGRATDVAAGIINPITGRRYVKSWRVDELIPFARETYRELEVQLEVSIFHQRNIIRTLFNAREENDWLLRTAEPGYGRYMPDRADLGEYARHTVLAYGYGEVRYSAQVDIGLLASAYRDYLEKNDCLLPEKLDYREIRLEGGKVSYKGRQAGTMIFCEGSAAVHNPFFNFLPFGGAKGEVLIIKIPDASFDKILKHRVFIVPLADNTYWVGSTYGWKYEDNQPTAEGHRFLMDRLKEVLAVPFEVIEHRAAIRPTVKDRRPFLGLHPEFMQLAIFNGLGTKGASLGPFFAHHMSEFLLKGKPLDQQVSIGRFD